MSQKKIDLFVIILGTIFLLSLIGMLFDIWQLVYYAIPIISIILFALGTQEQTREGKHKLPIIIFTLVTFVTFLAAGVTMNEINLMFWGLPIGTGIIYYVIWPLSTVSGIIYVMVRNRAKEDI